MDILNSKFDAVLHAEWKKDPTNDNRIIGYWAEDMAEYNLMAPHQLRDMIVEIQNWLSKKYRFVFSMDRNLKSISMFFSGLGEK